MILRFGCCRFNGKSVVRVLCLTFFPYDDSVVIITGIPRGNADQRRCFKTLEN